MGSVTGRGVWACVAVAVACSFEAGCKREGAGGTASQAGGGVELKVAREVGAGWFGEEKWEEAHQELTRVAADPGATAQDLVNLACVKLHRFGDDATKVAAEIEGARKLCEQALVKDPKCAAADYILGLISYERDLKPAVAKEQFAKAVEFAPEDLPARIRYAEALAEAGDADAAIEQYEVVHKRGLEFAGGYYKPAIYKLARLLKMRKKGDDLKVAAELTKEHTQLGRDGAPEAQQDDLRYGNLARVRIPPPAPRPGAAPKSVPAVRFELAGAPLLPEAGAIVSLDAADLNGDGCDDVVALGANGLWVALGNGKGKAGFTAREVTGAKGRITGTRVAAVHVENESGPSLLVVGPSGLTLLSPDAEKLFRDESGQLPAITGVNDLQAVDYDHEGHLDLLFATAKGVRLVRNDGVPVDQTTREREGPIHFTDVSEATGMPQVACDWVAIEDFDADQDIDFIVGGAATPPLIVSNLRKGRFEMLKPEKSGLSPALHEKPLLTDLDHDGRVDVVEPGSPPSWQRNKGDGTYEAPQPLPKLAPLFSRGATFADLDWNGEQDLVGVGSDGEVAVHFGALTAAEAPELALGAKPLAGTTPLLDDLDNDGALDLLTASPKGIEVRRGSVGGANALDLLLKGVKDNQAAIGALVEVRAGESYQRRLALGRRQIFGLGSHAGADVARITWPNGVVQSLVKPAGNVTDPPCPIGAAAAAPVAARVNVIQKEGLVGSCPFLYAWNGSRYEFVSDVLGTTPLGLPMKEGVYVPPDHDELVRVTGDQLKAADGEYRLQFTEELREVTFLDRAQLWVIDHPADVEVHPEERFTFPPFPPQKIHTIRHPLPIVKAVDQSGRDWTKELQQVDGVHAVPFQPVDSRFLGLVTSHVLELTLPDEVRTAKKVRLLMTGWLYWTDASVNVAADHNGKFDFVPPIFSVPDGHGEAGSHVGADGHGEAGSSSGWRECGPPVGFPAGKTKTMVLDVTSMLNRDDPRLRIFSTIRLYWDAIRVAVDDDDAPITVTKLEPKGARLWSRGFSAPVTDARDDHPARFDWDRLEKEPRWNQHRGMLTRYGDAAPLLGAVDDRFVILSAGDAIDLRFDAATTAPKSGLARTYLLFLDGWAKDADPNTMYSQTVEPLPFHAMSGYPYGDGEHYPDDDAHADYRAQWNTRPGRRLIESLVVPAGAASSH
jgi:hypothetical protein